MARPLRPSRAPVRPRTKLSGIARTVDYARLATERENPRTRRLDRLSTERLVAVITREDLRAAASVTGVRRPLARAIDIVAGALRTGGRLIYAGAGTSGRLGVLDAAECPPTFGVPPSAIVGLIAGGTPALRRAVEGAEDRAGDARRALARLRVGPRDVACGICASGVTPWSSAALALAPARSSRAAVS